MPVRVICALLLSHVFGGSQPSPAKVARAVSMRSFSDSTLRVPTHSAMIEWRNGGVQSRSARSTYVVIAFTPTSVRFARPGAAAGGHTFSRVSADEWSATLHPSSAGGQANRLRDAANPTLSER